MRLAAIAIALLVGHLGGTPAWSQLSGGEAALQLAQPLPPVVDALPHPGAITLAPGPDDDLSPFESEGVADRQTNLIAVGARYFQDQCTVCHDAEQSLAKRKTYDDWLHTVREMAQQEDARIPARTFVPIATYLASFGPPAAGAEIPPAPPEELPSAGSSEAARPKPKFDAQEVARGQAAFSTACTQCHEAERSLNKQKSLAGWLATVRRMSRLDGADVNASDVRPIAVYLASRNADAVADGKAAYQEAVADAFDSSAVNISATLSTLWRGGNDNLENPNFFADAWVRLDWQPEGPLRARVTACTSCHSDQTDDGGFTLELVEATAHWDLLHAWRNQSGSSPACEGPQCEAEVKAGRFVVPFGAFHAMSHPGVYRTVTNPLMFNMGRQVRALSSRTPVLPMPYSDEGVNLHLSMPVSANWEVSVDTYAVNGLQSRGGGMNFTTSRSYRDNNQDAGYGGRATIGNGKLRFGGSVMAGRMEAEGNFPQNYHFAGADATARLFEDVRLYFEYAMRRGDTIFGERQIVYGIVSELEVLLWERPNLSALVRYDTLEHRDFFGDASIARFTWGLSTVVAGTQWIFNHERWNFPSDEIEDVDVFGIRWVATF